MQSARAGTIGGRGGRQLERDGWWEATGIGAGRMLRWAVGGDLTDRPGPPHPDHAGAERYPSASGRAAGPHRRGTSRSSGRGLGELNFPDGIAEVERNSQPVPSPFPAFRSLLGQTSRPTCLSLPAQVRHHDDCDEKVDRAEDGRIARWQHFKVGVSELPLRCDPRGERPGTLAQSRRVLPGWEQIKPSTARVEIDDLERSITSDEHEHLASIQEFPRVIM